MGRRRTRHRKGRENGIAGKYPPVKSGDTDQCSISKCGVRFLRDLQLASIAFRFHFLPEYEAGSGCHAQLVLCELHWSVCERESHNAPSQLILPPRQSLAGVDRVLVVWLSLSSESEVHEVAGSPVADCSGRCSPLSPQGRRERVGINGGALPARCLGKTVIFAFQAVEYRVRVKSLGIIGDGLLPQIA
jgi:hypothetical protein